METMFYFVGTCEWDVPCCFHMRPCGRSILKKKNLKKVLLLLFLIHKWLDSIERTM